MATGNYGFGRMEERAADARGVYSDYLSDCQAQYEARMRLREERGIVPVAFCGYGRAGKDTAAEYLCEQINSVYPKSASWIILPLVAHMAGVSREQAWDERHQHRQFWIQACHALRGEDYGLLVRMCLGLGDVAVGIRGSRELQTIQQQRIVHLSIWIDNPRSPIDPTVEYDPSACDVMIPNWGSKEEFFAKLDKIIPLMKVSEPRRR